MSIPANVFRDDELFRKSSANGHAPSSTAAESSNLAAANVYRDEHFRKSAPPPPPPARYEPPASPGRIRQRRLNSARSDRFGLLANVVLLLGYAFALWFQFYEFYGQDRTAIAIFVYFLAFALLIFSGMIELGVDCFSVRKIGHGRYHSDSAFWNRIISVLFICAGALDVVAFWFWLKRDMETEIRVLLASSYVLLVMATLALFFQAADIRRTRRKGAIDKSDEIDLWANMLVFIVTIVGVVMRHLQYRLFQHENWSLVEATDRMELATIAIWLFSSLLYVITDVRRLRQPVQNDDDTGVVVLEPQVSL